MCTSGGNVIAAKTQYEYNKRYQEKHPEKYKEIIRKSNLKRRKKIKEWEKLHQDKIRETKKKWYLNNKDRKAKIGKLYRQKLRDEILAHYGNRCSCCDEAHKEFLSIDHINGGGRKHKQNIKGHLYNWLIANNFPVGFRILCHNCNQSFGAYGYCPHKKENNENLPVY